MQVYRRNCRKSQSQFLTTRRKTQVSRRVLGPNVKLDTDSSTGDSRD